MVMVIIAANAPIQICLALTSPYQHGDNDYDVDDQHEFSGFSIASLY